jgi:hypothetical protein
LTSSPSSSSIVTKCLVYFSSDNNSQKELNSSDNDEPYVKKPRRGLPVAEMFEITVTFRKGNVFSRSPMEMHLTFKDTDTFE